MQSTARSRANLPHRFPPDGSGAVGIMGSKGSTPQGLNSRFIVRRPVKTKTKQWRIGFPSQERRNTMKNQFIIKTNIGDIVVEATSGTVRKVAETILKNWTSRQVSYKIFPLGNKINKIKQENAKTLASLQYGDEVVLVPVYYFINFNNVKINKIKIVGHNVPLQEDGNQNLIYTGHDDLFYYTGKNHGRRRCDAHINQLDVWGNI